MQFQYKTEVELDGVLCAAIIDIGDVKYEHAPGSYSFNAASDADYHGYTDLEFDIESVEVFIDEQGTSFRTNSKKVIYELVTNEIYECIYDWLLVQMKKRA